MNQKLAFLIHEIAWEALLLFLGATLAAVFFMSLVFAWLYDGNLERYSISGLGEDFVLAAIAFPFVFVFYSFVVRLIVLEIPLRFFLRQSFSLTKGFSFRRLIVISVVVHSTLYWMCAGFLLNKEYALKGLIAAILIYCLSVGSTILAPRIVYRKTGHLFEPSSDAPWQSHETEN